MYGGSIPARNRSSRVILLIAFTFFFLHSIAQTYTGWQLQMHGGLSQMSGDVSGKPGIGGGIALQRNFSGNLGLRLDYTGSINTGLDTRLSQIANLNATQTRDEWRVYYGLDNKPFVANYRNRLHQLSLAPVFSIYQWPTNETSTINLYGTVGYSFLLADVDINALDASPAPYNFSRIDFSVTKKEVRKQLKSLLDKTYESNSNAGLSRFSNGNFIQAHAANAGVGVATTLPNRFGVQFEYRVTKPFIDHLDAYDGGSKSDLVHYVHVGVSYALTKKKARIVRHFTAMGMASKTTDAITLETTMNITQPTVYGTSSNARGDSSYRLHLRYTPVVIGSGSSQQILMLRLSNNQLLILPFVANPLRVPGTNQYEFEVRLPTADVKALASTKVIGYKFESTGYIYEDQLLEGSSDAFARIARQLLR